jgi:hypothetical protein
MLLTIAAGTIAGRILSTERVYEPSLARDPENSQDRRSAWPAARPNPMPTFSSNDRSRWATIRALVDDGTYVVGRRDKTLMLTTAVGPLGARHALDGASLLHVGYHLRIGTGKDRGLVSDRGIVFEDGWQTVDQVLHPAKLEY